MTFIVASIVERSISGVSRSSKKAFSLGADLVEVRLDLMEIDRVDADFMARVRMAVKGPAIATLRSYKEGGASRLTKAARRKALKAILRSGFEYIDLELESDADLLKEIKKTRTRPEIIASSHFTRPVKAREAETRLRRACKAGDIGKVAMPCEDASQALMLSVISMKFSMNGERFTLIGMGEQGQMTRVCVRQMGSSMVYCCMPGKPAAPGQLDLRTQLSLYRRDKVVLGLIGHPVSHSVSQPMQEAALARSGLIGAYLHLDVPPKNLDREILERFRNLGFKGLNVTIPHKKNVHSLCDRLGPSALATGAVNTVKFEASRIYGENTDVIGLTRMIEGKIRISPDDSALIVGAGGAARSAAYVLSHLGADVTVAARSLKKAKDVASMVDGHALPLPLEGKCHSYDIVVNCTPMGTKSSGGRIPIPARVFKKGTILFDLVYNPPMTKSMKIAMSREAKAVNGLDMLVHQGAQSFRIWTSKEPDVKAMSRAAKGALR